MHAGMHVMCVQMLPCSCTGTVSCYEIRPILCTSVGPLDNKHTVAWPLDAGAGKAMGTQTANAPAYNGQATVCLLL